MNGQLTFDEFMNITEEKPPEHKRERVPMVDPCYYCLCRSCINNAESLTVNPEEVPYDWRPCFFCDICNNFDGESVANLLKVKQKRRKPYLRRRKMKARPERKSMM